jgi:predicted phosphate transport protein (TIGR00153 family)
MLFWKKERQIEKAIEGYLQTTEECVASFIEAMGVYCEQGTGEAFEALVNQTHKHESAADDIRRDIELAMYRKALIPESRGDVLGMLEALDLVPNKCENVLYQIWMQETFLPKQFVESIQKFVAINALAHAQLCKTVRYLFSDVRQVAESARRVDEIEGQSDEIERHIVRFVFRSNIDMAEKILIKGIIRSIGAISDRSENASDRITNIAVKRQS